VIAALYVDPKGCYAGLPDVDPWDEERDARNYAGPWPVVAHPPCARWCMMAHLVQSRNGHRIGDDGGCFRAALDAVRRWGGVLEHPAESLAFAAHGLQRPKRNGWRQSISGYWTTEVNQAAYGHRATKRTWLVYFGATLPPALNWRRVRGTHQIGGFDVTKPELPKSERAATPPAFRDLLLSIARSATASSPGPYADAKVP
jgi:hypothetical protein